MIKVALLCLCPYSLCLFRYPNPHLESNATITLCFIYDNDPILKSIYRISSTWSQDTGLLLAPCLRVLLSCLECFFYFIFFVFFRVLPRLSNFCKLAKMLGTLYKFPFTHFGPFRLYTLILLIL